MKFDENSGLVKTWVRLVESKHYSKEQRKSERSCL